MERFFRVELFRKNSNTFRGITFFPFPPKRPEIFRTICLVTQCQASSWGKRWFVLTQARSLSGVLQIVQLWPIPLFGNVFNSLYHLSETFYWNFLTNGKRPRSWFWRSEERLPVARSRSVTSKFAYRPLHWTTSRIEIFAIFDCDYTTIWK